jgi:hypothetical protein
MGFGRRRKYAPAAGPGAGRLHVLAAWKSSVRVRWS